MMLTPSFHFVHEDRQRWKPYREEIEQWFGLLFPDGRQRFEDYLRSPFFVDRDSPLPSLFGAIYERAFDPEREAIHVAPLLRTLCGKTNFHRHGKRLKTLVANLIDHLNRFAAHEELNRRPVERQRLLCQSVPPEGNPTLFSALLERYTHQADTLPAGLPGAMHRWWSAHLDPTRGEGNKEPRVTAALDRLTTRFDRFTTIVGKMYNLEEKDRLRVLASEKTDPPAASKGELKDITLLTLYDELYTLKQQDAHEAFHYLKFSKHFSRDAERLDREQQLHLYLSLRNHTTFLRRQGRPLPPRIVAAWPVTLADRNVYQDFGPLPPLIVLDEYILLLINKQLADAERVLPKLLLAISPFHRGWVRLEAGLARHFFAGEFQEACEIANDPELQQAPVRDWRILLRRHSFRLRACLEVQLENPTPMHEKVTETALKSFEEYFRRLSTTPHPETTTYLANFRRICRDLFRLLSQYTKRRKTVRKIRTSIHDCAGKIHAGAWLDDYVSRVELTL